MANFFFLFFSNEYEYNVFNASYSYDVHHRVTCNIKLGDFKLELLRLDIIVKVKNTKEHLHVNDHL